VSPLRSPRRSGPVAAAGPVLCRSGSRLTHRAEAAPSSRRRPRDPPPIALSAQRASSRCSASYVPARAPTHVSPHRHLAPSSSSPEARREAAATPWMGGARPDRLGGDVLVWPGSRADAFVERVGGQVCLARPGAGEDSSFGGCASGCVRRPGPAGRAFRSSERSIATAASPGLPEARV